MSHSNLGDRCSCDYKPERYGDAWHERHVAEVAS